MIINQSGGVLIAGGVARDAELKYVGADGKPKCEFSVAYGKDANGKSVYANCEAWLAQAKEEARKEEERVAQKLPSEERFKQIEAAIMELAEIATGGEA